MLFAYKKVFLFLSGFLTFISAQAVVKYTINEGWRFLRADKEDHRLLDFDDGKWKLVNLPHTWNDQDAADDEPGYYRGIGWYRKSLFIDSSAAGKRVNLYFDGANQVTAVYVNEQFVGVHKGGYSRFCFDISRYIVPGAANLIAVKVDNSADAGIPPLSADFTFFGGIYRNLYLEISDGASLSSGDFASEGVYVRTKSVSGQEAIVEIQTLLDNTTDRKRTLLIRQSLVNPNGVETGTEEHRHVLAPGSLKSAVTYDVRIQTPFLWSPDRPDLYLLKTVIVDAVTNQELDSRLTSFGLRWFRFDPDHGFSLNDRHIKLIGTNRHQCYLDKGNALPDELHIEDIRLLKEMGGNFLRISHYPQDPLILDMCDKLGIITSVEIPIVNEITDSDEFLQNSLLMATEMVKQNFNHPSVVIWAYMNEVMLRPPFADDSLKHREYCAGVNRQAKTIETLLRKLDPERYTLIPFHGALRKYEEAGLVTVPMIVGWNLYQGWYGGRLGDLDSFLESYHAKYPRIPVLITEYGADVDERLHSFRPERFDFSVEYADLYHEHYLETIQRLDYVAGAAIWNLNDFYSESRTEAIPHFNTKGITTSSRQLKNTYLLYKTSLSKDPLAYIGSRSWQNRAGTDRGDGTCWQPVKIYCNQPGVDVYLNGVLFKKIVMPAPYVELNLPFVNGSNLIELRIEGKTYDFASINFSLLPASLQNGFSELNVMLGSNRYFEDREARIVWVPEQPYTPGSWGYTGGQAVRSRTKSGVLPFTSLDIANTSNDPVFQTQREDLRSFRLDVPPGRYAVYLYWADLNTDTVARSVYNLGNDAVNARKGRSVMNIRVNEQTVLTRFDISSASNPPLAIIKKLMVDVTDNKGITVLLDALEGKTVLNAIRVMKLN